jgi:predicted double-glycine peptidase
MKNKFLKLKHFQETVGMSYCGPASLKIVFDYYGVERSEKELAVISGWRKGMGVDDKGIKKAAESLGFKVKIKNNSNFRDIEKLLNKGMPVIVDWFTRGRSDYSDSEIADGHYSVVAGLDDKFIYLLDPEIGKIRKIKRGDFLRVWFDFRGGRIKKNELIIRQIIAIYKWKNR